MNTNAQETTVNQPSGNSGVDTNSSAEATSVKQNVENSADQQSAVPDPQSALAVASSDSQFAETAATKTAQAAYYSSG